ncbi:hypothetical protein GLU64_02960 [Nanohaloarchaea archaeon]|nr:hypothetical protein [Candidatus Nanohaloarchaea archaeon]
MALGLSSRQQVIAGLGILVVDFVNIGFGIFSGLEILDIISFVTGLIAGSVLIYRGKFKE